MTKESKGTKCVKILYMEDNPGLARLFQKKMERAGYHVEIALNGEEGLEKFKRGDFDVLAVDQAMPLLDGLSVIRILASEGGLPPTIMVTGTGDEETAVRALKLGAEDYIVKDVDCGYIDLLPAVIEGVLHKKLMAEEKRSAEKALRESEEKYRTLMENANDCILVIMDGKILFANPAFETLMGQKSQIIGHPFLDFVAPEDRERVEDNWKQVFAGKIPGPFEVRLITQDGRQLIMEAKSNRIQYQGKTAAMAIMRDISDRKKMEEELLRAKKLESVGILAGGIAHDYNNILAAILGNISLAQTYLKPGDKVYQLLADAEHASTRAKELTHKFIIFAKGGEPIKRELRIEPFLKNTVELMLSGSRLTSEFSFTETLWPVFADESKMGQVVQNILANANDVMPEGGNILVAANNVHLPEDNTFSLPAGKYVRISIEDNGPGIAEELLEKIFDPYFSTKRRGAQKGMGLGLSISHSIVKKHGGHIAVESSPGAGTKFEIYLPAGKKDFNPGFQAFKKTFSDKPKSILLMDDEQMVRNVANQMLSYLGFDVVLARDGNEAVGLFERAWKCGKSFDVVVLDLTVRGGPGGKDTLKKIRQIDPNIKALVSSGYSDDPVMKNHGQFGFDGSITKPYNIEQLKNALLKIV